MEKIFVKFFFFPFLGRSPKSATEALEKRSSFAPSSSVYTIYTAEEITSPCMFLTEMAGFFSPSLIWQSLISPFSISLLGWLWPCSTQAVMPPFSPLLQPCLSFYPIPSLYTCRPKVYVLKCSKCLASCLCTTLNRISFLNRGLILEQPQLPVQQALFLLQSLLSYKCSFHKAFCNQFPPQCHLHFPLYLNYCPVLCFCQI